MPARAAGRTPRRNRVTAARGREPPLGGIRDLAGGLSRVNGLRVRVVAVLLPSRLARVGFVVLIGTLIVSVILAVLRVGALVVAAARGRHAGRRARRRRSGWTAGGGGVAGAGRVSGAGGVASPGREPAVGVSTRAAE